MKKFLMMAAMACTLGLAGCGDNPADGMEEALVREMDTKLCLKELYPPFVYSREMPWLEPLVKAELLTREVIPPKGPLGMKKYVYTMTDKAKKAEAKEGRFCYGKSKFVRFADGYNPPKDMPTKPEYADVIVKYEVTEDWAKSPELSKLVDSGEKKVAVVLTPMGDGKWSVDF